MPISRVRSATAYRHDAIGTDRSEHQRDTRKDGQQGQDESPPTDRFRTVDHIPHGPHIRPHFPRIDCKQAAAQLSGDPACIGRRTRAYHQEHVVLDDLRIRAVDRHRGRVVQARLPHVRDNADNLAPDALHGPCGGTTGHGRPFFELHPPAQRVAVPEVPPRKAFADDRNWRTDLQCPDR